MSEKKYEFYKITNEQFIDKIINSNPEKLIVLLFSLENNIEKKYINTTYKIKKYIKHDIKEDENYNNFDNIIFLYINLSQFVISNKNSKYILDINKDNLPYISFIYGNMNLARIKNTDFHTFKDQILQFNNVVKKDIEKKIKDKITEQRRLDEIEKTKQNLLIIELNRIKKSKEIQEQIEKSSQDDNNEMSEDNNEDSEDDNNQEDEDSE